MSIYNILNLIFKTESIPLDEVFNKQEGKIYTFVNPYSYHLVRKNIDLYSHMDGMYVDGILMCKFCKWIYGTNITRRSFDNTSFAKILFEQLDDNQKGVYFVGAQKEEIKNAIRAFKEEYTNLNIIGFNSGYFSSPEEMKEIIDQIISLNPAFVIVGMGAIQQELFLLELKNNGYKGIAFSCGGFIRQSSTGFNYFPIWINKLHLRAIYRLIKEKGTVKRLYNVLIQFPVLFIYDFFRRNK